MQLTAGFHLQSALTVCIASFLQVSVTGAQRCSFEWTDPFNAPGMKTTITAMATFDDGTGLSLYAGLLVEEPPIHPEDPPIVVMQGVAKWTSTGWTTIGNTPGLGGGADIFKLLVFDDGSGPQLYAGGSFTTIGGISANRIARWNGTIWSPLGAGVSGSNFPRVLALAAFDDGTGPALFVGGEFTIAGGVTVNHVAMWNGTNWSSLSTGLQFQSPVLRPRVDDMVAFDDGSGTKLYVCGQFASAGGVPANYVARLNGASWSALGSGLQQSNIFNLISGRTMALFDDGQGTALYVGGTFDRAGGVTVLNIARWNGTSWSPVGSLGGANLGVSTLQVFNVDSAPQLCAGGTLFALSHLATWDGTAWSTVGGGANASVANLWAFNDELGPALYAAGQFTQIGGLSIPNIARWGCATTSAVAGDLDADGDVDLADFATFAVCFAGAGTTTPPGGCSPEEFAASDLDSDGDVDLGDFATFASNFMG